LRNSADFIFQLPRYPVRGRTLMKRTIQSIIDEIAPKPKPPVPTDLDNQTLSKDPLERARQLDQQAQKNEERIARP
jgi:hypothetical protein